MDVRALATPRILIHIPFSKKTGEEPKFMNFGDLWIFRQKKCQTRVRTYRILIDQLTLRTTMIQRLRFLRFIPCVWMKPMHHCELMVQQACSLQTCGSQRQSSVQTRGSRHLLIRSPVQSGGGLPVGYSTPQIELGLGVSDAWLSSWETLVSMRGRVSLLIQYCCDV